MHRLRHLRRRLPERSDQARIILQEGIKKLFPRKEELFYCLFPNGSADTPETRGRSTHTACRHNGFTTVFQPISTTNHDPADRYTIRPEAPSKGISRKGRNTSDDSGGAVHHRTSKDTCTGILPQTNLSVCRIYLLYLIIEHRNIAGEAYPAMSNACFSP